jgi:cytochrome o ubiquinol oxidase subunit II
MHSDGQWISGVLDPQGPIGAAERTILLNATSIMLAVIIPVIVLALAIAWWFRAGNSKAKYLPDWSYSGPVELVVWSIPALVITFLGGIAWISSHDLDPPKPIPSLVRPLEVQVVALDWKWLFVFPEQGVASVNTLVVPTGAPLHFSITSGSVMNSFFIPQLGSQIYAMAGTVTQLELRADVPGTYSGLSAQFSGEGFSDMRFDVQAVPQAEFETWLGKVRSGGGTLDTATYRALARPGVPDRPSTYGSVPPRMFETILADTVK